MCAPFCFALFRPVVFRGYAQKPAAGHKAEKTCVPSKSRALGFVCRAKKPRNLVGKGRANSALFSVTRFSPLLWENTTGKQAFAKTNSSAFDHTQQTLSRPGVLQWPCAGYGRKFGTAARGLSKFTDGIKTQNLVGKGRANSTLFLFVFFGAARRKGAFAMACLYNP